MTEAEREDVLNEIVDREVEMFMNAPAAEGEDEAPRHPEALRLMRRMTLSSHGDAFLHSYLSDLREAERDGRNFMEEKYALMNGGMPPLSESPLLNEIADAETGFLEEAADMYPDIIKRAGSDTFRKFLHSELQTLSPKSLALYAEEINAAIADGRNPVVERHNWLAAKLGRPPLPKRKKAGDC